MVFITHIKRGGKGGVDDTFTFWTSCSFFLCMGNPVFSLPKEEEEEEEEPISYLSDRSRIGDFVQAGRILDLDRKTIN